MSRIFSHIWDRLFGKSEYRAIFVGLDAAGKTTILYQIKLGEVVTTIPTIGFNVETLPFRESDITAWDVGGRSKTRPLIRHYISGTQILVVVVDSTDHERVPEIAEEYEWLLKEEELDEAVLLFFANKQDLPNALTVQQISDRLGLRHTCKSRHWHIQGSSAVTGEGLYEGFLWAVDTLKAIENGKKVKSKRTGDDIVIIQDRQKKKETMHQRKFQANLQYEKELMPIKDNDPISEAFLFTFLHEVFTLHSDAAKGWIHNNTDKRALVDAHAWVESHLRLKFNIKPLIAKGPRDDIIHFIEWYRPSEDSFLKKFRLNDHNAWYRPSEDRQKTLLHHDRIFACWILLRKHEKRRDALAEIFSLFENYQGEKFHMTTSYFWAHIIHYAITSQVSSAPDFAHFLMTHPYLTDDQLIYDFYTKEIILSDTSKTAMVFPTIKSLPSLIQQVRSSKTTPVAIKKPDKGEYTDQKFIDDFENNNLSGWNHEIFLRAIFCILKRYGRQDGTKRICKILKTIQGHGFHMSLTRFWISMVVLHRMEDDMDFSTFWKREKKNVGDSLMWREYYSDALIDDAKSATDLWIPDKKQLPSFRGAK